MNNILKILLICFVFLFLALSTLTVRIITNSEKRISTLRGDILSAKKRINTQKDIMLWQYRADNKTIDKNSYLCNIDSQTITISELTSNNNKLFVYVHSPQCQSCLDLLMDEIGKLEKYIDKKDLIFYGNFKDSRYMELFKSLYPTIDNIYNTNKSNFENPVNTLGVPALFIVNRDLNISCIYIADKSISSNITTPYFQIVGKRFFDWDEKLDEINSEHLCTGSNCQHVH